MVLFSRRWPGGVYPRLVALFPLLFPFFNVQGVLIGVSVSLPELFLVVAGLSFLFQYESFRLRKWLYAPRFFAGEFRVLFSGDFFHFPLVVFFGSSRCFL